MIKLILLFAAILWVALLSACTTMGGDGGIRVECPSCGLEFTAGDPHAG